MIINPQYENHAVLEELIEAARYVEKGQPLPKSLQIALLHGTSVGGARPKALINDNDHKYIAKFSSSTDFNPIVQLEYATMWLAKTVGLNTANVKLVETSGKTALLVERFDRAKQQNKWTRKFMISALTLLGLDEFGARYASYLRLADYIVKCSPNPEDDLLELFRRMVFNVLVGNTDDHAKNHAFFWDGKNYQLTPAYDICPFPRAGQEATQAMIIGEHGAFSQLTNILSGASHFQLSETQARHEIDQLVEAVREHWPEAADRAGLTQLQRDQFTGTSILNPFCFFDY